MNYFVIDNKWLRIDRISGIMNYWDECGRDWKMMTIGNNDLTWIFYFSQGVPSWKWYFPYHYAPFASDFLDLSTVETLFEKGTKPVRSSAVSRWISTENDWIIVHFKSDTWMEELDNWNIF